jgi:hypothetical protein
MGLYQIEKTAVGGTSDENERVTKKAQKGYIEGRRPAGRPIARWIDAVDRDGKRTFTDHCHREETQLQ